MATSEEARKALSRHGRPRPQPETDWKGTFPLPEFLARFYREVGPSNMYVDSHGNPYFFPSLAKLWKFQEGYRWEGRNQDPSDEWDDDWLVVADEGGDPFIASRESGVVSFAEHGVGRWKPVELFPDMNTAAFCLGQLGGILRTAGQEFTDEQSRIRPEYLAQALAGLKEWNGSSSVTPERVLEVLGWC